MMEYTDKHQRTLMRLMSKEAVLYTEMVVANAIIRSDHRESLIEANFDVEDHEPDSFFHFWSNTHLSLQTKFVPARTMY